MRYSGSPGAVPCRPRIIAGGDGEEEEDGSEDDTDDDDGGGGGMSVMDMLAANEAAEAAKNAPAAGHGKQRQGKGKGTGSRASGDGAAVAESNSSPAPTSVVSSADASGDEAGFDGDAMEEEDSDEDEDEDEDGEDSEERHTRLLGFVGKLGDQAAAAQRAAEDRRSSQLLKEGEFNATAVAATSGGGGAGGAKQGAVTMEVRGRGGRHVPGVLRVDCRRGFFRSCAVPGRRVSQLKVQGKMRGSIPRLKPSDQPPHPAIPFAFTFHRSPACGAGFYSPDTTCWVNCAKTSPPWNSRRCPQPPTPLPMAVIFRRR